VKPFNGIQLVQVQPGQSIASGPGASVAVRQVTGDGVHSEEAGREESAPTSNVIAMPTPLVERKAASKQPIFARLFWGRRSR
jgi:hypothetical protein